MAGRYVWPFQRRGAGPVASIEAQNEAKKMLALLDERRQLSGVQTVSMRRELSDGTRIFAAFFGNKPLVQIFPAERSGDDEVRGLLFDGFFTKPREIGERLDPAPVDRENGENAYGQEAHVVLRDRAPTDELPDWVSFYFDADYLPEGAPTRFYSVMPKHDPFFGIGLVNHGRTDWRGINGMSVNWHGAEARSLDTDVQRGYVFHNGRLILDLASHSGLSSQLVHCACLKLVGTQLFVYVITAPSSFSAQNVQLLRAPLRPHPDLTWWYPLTAAFCPQLDLVVPGELELLLTVPMTEVTDEFWTVLPGAFNQSATEARVLIMSFTDDFQGHQVHEVVFDVGTTPSYEVVDRGFVKQRRTTTQGPTTARINGNRAISAAFDPSELPPDPIPDGAYVLTPIYTQIIYDGITTTNPLNYPSMLVTQDQMVTTVDVIGVPIPIAVDYKDDMPARLFWSPGASSVTTTYAADFSSTFDIVGQRTDTISGEELANLFEQYDRTEHWESASASSYIGTRDGVRLYVEYENGERWFDISLEGTVSGSFTKDTVLDSTFQHIYNADVPATGPGYASAETSLDYVHNVVGSTLATGRGISILHLDMRSDSIAYIVGERTRTTTQNFSRTASETYSAADVSIATAEATLGTYVTTPTGTLASDTTVTRTLHVVSNRIEVLTREATQTASQSTPYSGSSTTINNAANAWAALIVDYPVVGIQYAINIIARTDASARSNPSFFSAAADALRADRVVIPFEDVDLTEEFDFGPNVTVDFNFSGASWFDALSLRESYNDGLFEFGLVDPWFESPDTDTNTVANNQNRKGYGTCIMFEGRWAMSVPWPGSDISVPTWLNVIAGEEDPDGATINEVTGNFDPAPALYSPMLPISRCISYLPPGLSDDDVASIS